MIANIIDRRKRRYRWKSVDVVIEATAYDNTITDSDQSEEAPEEFVLVESRNRIPLGEAITWANGSGFPVTLFIYDAGANSDPEED